MKAAQVALTGENAVDAARALVGQDGVQEEAHGQGTNEGAEQDGVREPAAE
jgi:hypothetical protein